MKIGIDARLIQQTGVGRYIRNIVTYLSRIDKKNFYRLYVPDDAYESVAIPDERWSKQRLNVRWHTVREQLMMPSIFAHDNLDLVHVPYFTAPLLYRRPYIITIHDLTILHTDTGRASTLPYMLYKMKRFGYRYVLSKGLAGAKHVIAVSQATKNDICAQFPVSRAHVSVIYEGVDDALMKPANSDRLQKPLVRPPYLLYVGNAYPHKNLETLIEAFSIVTKQSGLPHMLSLVLVGGSDFFYTRLQQTVRNQYAQLPIRFFGYADDQALSNLYAHAEAFIFPSLSEGFGLPGLEAMATGIPVLASDIDVFHEIYGDAAVYFRADNPKHIARTIQEVLADEHRKKELVLKGKKKATDFSWEQTARQTLAVYTKAV